MTDTQSEHGDGCRHPECDAGATETYRDRFGNELALCDEHYFEAVFPGPVPISRIRRKEKPDSGVIARMFK